MMAPQHSNDAASTFRVERNREGRWVLFSWNARIEEWEAMTFCHTRDEAVETVDELGGSIVADDQEAIAC